jgi:hypothetical protein
MINKPNVKSETEFWDWFDGLPVGENWSPEAMGVDLPSATYCAAIAARDGEAALHLCFGENHYKESDWPHAAWSDMADSIYFAIKRLDYFDVHWRVNPEIDASVSFTGHRMVRQSYVRLTVVPRERPTVVSDRVSMEGWTASSMIRWRENPPVETRGYFPLGTSADGRGGLCSDVTCRICHPITQGPESRIHESGDVVVTLASNSEYEYLNVPTTYPTDGVPMESVGVKVAPQTVKWSDIGDPSEWVVGVDPAVTHPEKFYWMGPNGLRVTQGGYVAEPIMPLSYKEIGSGMMDFMGAVDQIRDSLTLSAVPMLPGLLSNSIVYTQAYVDEAERIHNRMMNELRASMGIEPLPEKPDGE